MSEPEIARRCLSCGATVRQLAYFCPQCGEPLKSGDSDQPPTAVADPINPDHKQPTVGDPLMTQPLTRSEPVELAETQPLIGNTSRDTILDLRVPPVGRAAESPIKAYEDQKLGRVERIRKVSSIMIDQAAYDPSLRFLLVAAILFVIFLVLMVLSKVLG